MRKLVRTGAAWHYRPHDGSRHISGFTRRPPPCGGRGRGARSGWRLPALPEARGQAGHWEFPGGKVKEGETLEEALRRELEEELGIEVSVGERLSTLEYSYPHLDITLHLFRCGEFEGEPRELYHTAITWLAPAEIDRASLVPSNLPFLDILPRSGEDIPSERP